MAPKPWLISRAAVLQLLLLLLLLLQADPLNGEAVAARPAPPPPIELQEVPNLTSFPFNLLDAVTRRPRQIRFKSSYLELPVGLRGLVGIRGLGHLSYFVQVDVPVTPTLSKALDRLPEGTNTYFPPYVSLRGAATPEGPTTETSHRPSVVSKTLASEGGKGRITLIPIKNLSQINDNELDTLLSTSTVSTILKTDGGLSATPTYSTSSNPTTSVVQSRNVSYSSSGISWFPEHYNFLRASSLKVSSSPPSTIKVSTTPSIYVTSTPTLNIPNTTSSTTITTTSSPRVTTIAPVSSSLPATLSVSSSFLSSYYSTIFSTTTPLPLTQHTSLFPPAATSSARSLSLTPSDSYLPKKHFTSQTPSPSPTSPTTSVASTPPKIVTAAPSSSTLPHSLARYPPSAKSSSVASSFLLIKKHSSALKSFSLPSSPSTSQSFTFSSSPAHSSVELRAPSSSKASPPQFHSLTPSSTTASPKHFVKYAKFTPISSPAKSVKVLTPPSTSETESSSLSVFRPLRTTSFESVNLPKRPFKATSGINYIGHPSMSSLSFPARSVLSTSRLVSSKHPLGTITTLPPVEPPVPLHSSRPLSSINNFFFQASQPSIGLSNSTSSRLLAQTRTFSKQSSSPSFKHKTATSSPSTPPTKPKLTAVGTNPKTFSSTPAQLFPNWKQGRVARGGKNAKKRVRGRLMEEVEGIGKVVKGRDRGRGSEVRGKEGGEEGGMRSKAGKRTLGDIILERKLQLEKIIGGNKRAGARGTVSRLGRLQVQKQQDRGNRAIADGQRGDFPAPKTTTSPPNGITRHRDVRTHNDNDDDNDDDDIAVPKSGSPGRPRHSSAVSRTAFSCPNGSEGGYFADQETGCQVFHVCWGKRRAAFLCPEGTLFNQLVQVCDWWYNVDCNATSADGKHQSARDT